MDPKTTKCYAYVCILEFLIFKCCTVCVLKVLLDGVTGMISSAAELVEGAEIPRNCMSNQPLPSAAGPTYHIIISYYKYKT